MLEQGAFSAMPAALHQELIALNVAAPTALIAAFLPGMLARGHGRILNVASIAAMQPLPGLATYAASKAYVLSLTESLAEELRDSGVTVTALCPGITATAMLDSAAAHNKKLAELPGFLIGDVDAVAEAGWRACMDGETVVVPGAVNQAIAAAAGATPRWLSRRVAGVIGRKAI
jgi:short-subunit dehydrogenase